jgi:hypothetical protein
MNHSELAIAGFYDHEHDSVPQSGRRIADWGGDDVFAAPTRRRFERAVDASWDLEPAESVEPAEPGAAVAIAEPEFEAPEPEPAPQPVGPELYAPDRYLAPVPSGRRTVTITGHPGDRALAFGARRPGRTLDERIAHAPERIAGWAFGLGLLLILIAILTSH